MNEEKLERVSIDIDTRLLWLWIKLGEMGETFTLEEIAPFIRGAYGQGWTDALREPRGKLAADNGYRVPRSLDESAE
jgi:hypothetical protein